MSTDRRSWTPACATKPTLAPSPRVFARRWRDPASRSAGERRHGPRASRCTGWKRRVSSGSSTGKGAAYDVSEVLGSGGVSYAGEREILGAFAETLLPVMERLDLRFAGRAGRVRRRGHAALLARRGRIPADRRADRAGFLERRAARSRVFPAPRHRVPELALCRVRSRTRRPAPHMLQAERAPGRAQYGRELRSGSDDRRPACRGGRVREGALPPEPGVVSGVVHRSAGKPIRRLGASQPGGVRRGHHFQLRPVGGQP